MLVLVKEGMSLSRKSLIYLVCCLKRNRNIMATDNKPGLEAWGDKVAVLGRQVCKIIPPRYDEVKQARKIPAHIDSIDEQ
jgi:hypothetical protein